MKRLLGLLLVVAIVGLPAPSAGQGLGVALHAGTLGLGGDVQLGLGSHLALRGGYNFFPVDPELTISDVKYTIELPASIITLTADIYPSATSSFHLFGGIRIQDGDIVAVSDEVSETRNIGGTDYTQSGAITGALGTKSTAPMVGLGWGNPAAGGGFFFQLGAVFQGDPTVRLNATGDLASAPGILDRLTQEEDDLADDANLLKIWPIVSIGFTINLGG